MSNDSGVWRWQIATLRKQFPGLALNSGFRNNSVVAGSGSLSYHATGHAVDVPPRMDVFNWIVANFPSSAEIIFTPAGNRQIWNGKPHVYSGQTAKDHYSHVHWAWTGPTTDVGGATNAQPAGLIDGAAATFTGLSDFVGFFTAPGVWARVGVIFGGVVLLLLGFTRLAGTSSLSTIARKAIPR